MNAIVPDALHGKLKWKDITSAERSEIHATVCVSTYDLWFPNALTTL
jgi:hypothetical protein